MSAKNAIANKGTLPPKPFYMIFFLEFWERFGYYGVQAVIVLFMVQHLDYTDKQADTLFASFSALVFLLPCVGGYLGDNILGTKRATVLGAVILAIGYFMLCVPYLANHLIFLPLAVIGVGNGIFKANPASLLSKVYENTGQSSDSAFTLYYMAVNIGALVSISSTPIVNQYYGWYAAFGVSAFGLILALCTFFIGSPLIKKIGSKPDFEKLGATSAFQVFILLILLVGGSFWLLSHQRAMFVLLVLGVLGLLMLFAYQIVQSKAAERKGMLLFVILFLQAILFFVLYFQMPTSLTLFALRNVDHHILGIPVSPASFQALNPFWIIVMSPVLAILYQKLTNKNKDLSMPAKFALGTFLAGSAFLVLPLSSFFANENGIVSGNWLLLSYFLQSTGELLVGALGLSLVSRYIPQRLMGFTMGLWFLCSSIASEIAGVVAGIAEVPKHITDPVQSLHIYNHLFLEIGVVTVAISLIMALFVPKLKKLAAGGRV